MSRKKERKLKRIRNRGIWYKIIGGIVAKVVGIMILFLFVALAGLISLNTYLLESDRDMKSIVQITEQNWQNKDALVASLNDFKTHTPSIEKISFVNDDLVPLEIRPSEQTKGIAANNKNYLQRMLVTRKIARTQPHAQEIDMRAEILKSLLTLNFITLYKNTTMLQWANTDSFKVSQQIFYKTNIEGVNVCADYIYHITNFHANIFVFMTVFLLIVFLAAFVFEMCSIFSLIRDKKNINKIVYTDSVTGGNNKDYFLHYAAKAIAKNNNYVVAQIRLEKYRNYCTAYGLRQGENLLEEIYDFMLENLGKKELAAHLEKADFALLLKFESEEQLYERLKKMLDDINERQKKQHLLFSAGICKINSKADDITFLVTAAGLALSKNDETRSSIVWFNQEMKEEQVWERRIEDDMEAAIINHEFQVYLQPKYSTKKEELSAAEALVRWVHPVLGFISPGKFIPFFEENGFITHLDDYMLTEIAKLQAKWLSEGKKLIPISVNVSRAHFSYENLAEHICEIIDKYKVPHEFIELELTESAFFDDKATLLKTVLKLKDYGFKVSMDDFGAGYSSLNSLKELPLDIIKLDAEFFRGIEDVKRANTIVGETIALAKKLGMAIVAEGIETREQVEFLAKQDCDLIQGFYFSKPLPVDEFIQKAWS